MINPLHHAIIQPPANQMVFLRSHWSILSCFGTYYLEASFILERSLSLLTKFYLYYFVPYVLLSPAVAHRLQQSVFLSLIITFLLCALYTRKRFHSHWFIYHAHRPGAFWIRKNALLLHSCQLCFYSVKCGTVVALLVPYVSDLTGAIYGFRKELQTDWNVRSGFRPVQYMSRHCSFWRSDSLWF